MTKVDELKSNTIKHQEASMVMLVSLCVCVYFIWLSSSRLIDGDEGFYLAAAKLVLQGETPYIDFFYPQMPLSIYCLAAWLWIFNCEWEIARFLMAVYAILSAVFVYGIVYRLTNDKCYALIALVSFMSSSLCFGWLTVVKTYSLSLLILLAAYYYLIVYSEKIKQQAFLLGLFLGLATLSRLYLSALIPFALYFVFRRSIYLNVNFTKPFFLFILGGVPSFVLLLCFIIQDSNVVWFNNVTYHIFRSDDGLIMSLIQKLTVLFGMLGVNFTVGIISFQFVTLMMLNVFCFFGGANEHPHFVLAISIFLILFIVSLIPSPTYPQYLSIVIPFLIISAVVGLHHLQDRRFGVFLIVSYVLVTPMDLNRYTSTGVLVPGITSVNTEPWNLSSMRVIADEIDRLNISKKPVMSFWPGYNFSSGSPVFPNASNHFSFDVADRLNLKDKKRFHVYSQEDLISQINCCDLIVVDSWFGGLRLDESILVSMGFEKVSRLKYANIYRKKLVENRKLLSR